MLKNNLSTMVLGQLKIDIQKNKVGPWFTQYNVINSKWKTELNVGVKAIKLYQESEKRTHRKRENII